MNRRTVKANDLQPPTPLWLRLAQITWIVLAVGTFGMTVASVPPYFAAFSATLRGSVDLSEVTDQLMATVDSTMQPAHVSLWLSLHQRARPDNSPYEA